MEIKDINVEVERLEEVRGGTGPDNVALVFANMGGDDINASYVNNFGLGEVGVAQSNYRPQQQHIGVNQASSKTTTTNVGIADSMVGLFGGWPFGPVRL